MVSLPTSALVPVVVLWAMLGLAVGSFLSVVVSRVPAGRGVRGRSMCPGCNTTLGPRELIPVVSYVLLGGKCRTCKRSISWEYPLLEVSSAALFLLGLWLQPASLLRCVLLTACLVMMLAIAVIDLHTQRIPDVLTGPFIVLAAAFALANGAVPALSILIIAGFLGCQWLVSRGQWIGSGDVLLAVGIGCLLYAWPVALAGLLLSYSIGAIVVATLLVTKRLRDRAAVPFVPFLFAGTLLALVIPRSVFLVIGV